MMAQAIVRQLHPKIPLLCIVTISVVYRLGGLGCCVPAHRFSEFEACGLVGDWGPVQSSCDKTFTRVKFHVRI